MGIMDFIFKTKKEREQDAKIKDVLRRTDDTIARIENGLDQMKRDDEKWKKNVGY